MYQFKLPDLGEGIHEAEILKWHHGLGERVEEDAPLVDLETDKATVTIPSPVAGTLVKRAGEAGALVQVGQVLVVIDDGSAAKPDVASPPDPAATPEQAGSAAAAKPEPAAPVPGRDAGRPVPAAPATRRLARELKVDIGSLHGSGPAGRITAEDVRAQAAGSAQPGHRNETEVPAPGPLAAPPAPPSASALPDFSRFGPVQIEALRSIRRKTAHKMTTAWQQIPHVAHFDEADVTELESFRQRRNSMRADGGGAKLSLLPFVAKAVVSILRRYPQFNASIDMASEQIILKGYYNLGVAVATERGLMVPVVHGAEAKSIADLAEAIANLAGRGRDGTLTAEDFSGGTFTITNMGSLGGQAATPIINHPEVAILATMRAQEKAVVRGGKVVVRTMLPLVLSFDHRLIDGADAAKFVNEIVRLLSDPETLLTEA